MSILERLLKLIRDDNYAAGFQSLGQYRTALLQAARGEVAAAVAVAVDGLLPCPFCGQPPTEYDQIGYSSVKCHECKFSIKVKSENGPPYAPDLWNRRVAPAVQGEPFMYGIASPDGDPHFDEHCVSSTAHCLQEEIDALNSDDVTGYRVVALYTTPQPAPDVAGLLEALEEAKTGLEWYQQEYPQAVSECDHEVIEGIDTALAPYRKQGGAA